ncbi:hypothetical protein [Microbacterium sp. MRS-1]|uniref:hypothetical protein n=1 Tax=Microbacterium sp. MRS-1 TaxID=1451261 RepID=UPI0012DF6EC6|nr:hypothetical protein [Microbacterium sp. MRS-1]
MDDAREGLGDAQVLGGEPDGDPVAVDAELIELHARDPRQWLPVDQEQQCCSALERAQGCCGDEELLDVREALLLGDDRGGLREPVGDLDDGEVAMFHGPADESAGQASCGGAAGEPAVDVRLPTARRGGVLRAEVGEELERDGGGLFSGEERAFLQLAGLGEIVHAVEVDPAAILDDQSCIVRVRERGLPCQPGLEPFDVEMDGGEDPVLDAELAEEPHSARGGIVKTGLRVARM